MFLASSVNSIAAGIPGILDAYAIWIGPSGAGRFIDLHLTMDGLCSLNMAHATADAVERANEQAIPKADVTAHVEPNEGALSEGG